MLPHGSRVRAKAWCYQGRRRGHIRVMTVATACSRAVAPATSLYTCNTACILHLSDPCTPLQMRGNVALQVLGRAAALFVLGMFLQGGVPGHFATFDLATVRVMGILQRIARAPPLR